VKLNLEKSIEKLFFLIKALGHETLNETLNNDAEDDRTKNINENKEEEYKTLISSISKADIVILEVSRHSLSMGYWLQKALDLNKPVIAIYLNGYETSFLNGINNDKLQVIAYDLENLEDLLKDAIEKASGAQDTRFNFFISPRHQAYLDWIARERKIPRSVFLRRLIDEHMRKNKDFNEV
jgi:hypothetical protein